MKNMMKKALVIVLALALALVVPMTAMASDGGATLESAVAVSAATGSVTVSAGDTAYYYYENWNAPSMYNLDVEGATGFVVASYTMGMMGNSVADENGLATTTVSAGRMPQFYFSVTNNTADEQTYTYSFYEPFGSYGNPGDIVIGENTVATAGDWNGFSSVYTAPADGTFTFEMVSASGYGWWFTLEINDMPYDYTTYYSDNEPLVDTMDIDVVAGDVVRLIVNTYNPLDYANYNPAADVVFTAYFEANEKASDNAWSEYAQLVEGDNDVVLDGTVETTLYEFVPERTGKFTVTVNDGMLVSDWGANTWPQKNGDSTDTVVIECTSVGQGFLVGVEGAEGWAPTATVSISWEELVIEPEFDEVIYENVTAPEAFEFEGDANELVYVDVEDDVVNSAVLGEDGYYHLDSADGPILYVNLSDGAMSMVDLVGLGNLTAANTENGEVVEMVYFTDAMLEYIAVADTVETADGTMTLYPLTEDLMVMYQDAGSYMGWYGAEGWMGLEAEDAWMFACCYVAEADNGDDEVKDEITNPEIPNTDIGTTVYAWAIVMMLASVACATIVIRKTKRVK